MSTQLKINSVQVASETTSATTSFFTAISPITSVIVDVLNTIPNALNVKNPVYVDFLNNSIEIVLLIISIVIINDKKPDKILDKDTPEGIVFIVFLVLIIITVLHTVYLYLFKLNKPLSGVDPNKLYYMEAGFVILLFIIINTINGEHPKTILNENTPEGKSFIVLLIFLLLTFLHLLFSLFMGVMKSASISEIIVGVLEALLHSVPQTFIIFAFSFVFWFLGTFFNTIQSFFTGSDGGDSISKQLSDLMKNPEESKLFYKYSILYLVIFAIIAFVYFMMFNPSVFKDNMFTYLLGMVMLLTLIFYFFMPYSAKQSSAFSMFSIGMIATFFIAIIYFFSKANAATNEIMNYVMIFITIAIIIITLATIFYILNNYLKTMTGWSGLMVYFIFYIPCLFIDFIKYILGELRATDKLIYILLVLEVVFIMLYFYLPSIIKRFNTTKNVVLLEKSAFLDSKQTIGNGELNKTPKFLRGQKGIINDKGMNDEPLYNMNYAFSMWIYLNPQPPNNIGYASESEIFNYGDGKPRITYFNDISSDTNNFGKSGVDKYRIYFSNMRTPIGYYDFTMPGQKWNNITVNFTSTQADLFVNGKLEYTYNYRGNPPTYMPVDFITIGQDKGLDGAICNVIYYPKNLSLIEITTHYNLLMLKNPPY